MALVSVLEKRQIGDGGVIGALAPVLAEQRTIIPPVEENWIRGSSIARLCPREEVLCARHNVSRNKGVTADEALNFLHGHAIHWLMQNRAIPLTGLMIGTWRCTWCGETYGSPEERVTRPGRCVRCGAIAGEIPRSGDRPDEDVRPLAFLYAEEFVFDEELRIGGHPDGFLQDGDSRVLLEFKSANEHNFHKYKDFPDFEHVIQVQVYMHLTATLRAKIIYFNKGGGGGKAFLREHDVSYDPEVFDRVKAMVAQVRAGISGGAVPPRTICTKSDCQRAFRCEVKNLCFQDAV